MRIRRSLRRDGSAGVRGGHVWLNGQRSGEYHLLDLASGRVARTVQLGHDIRTTAGMGRRCGRHFVSVYVAPDGDTLVLQVDRLRYPLDDLTVLRHEARLGGAVMRLTVERSGTSPCVLTQRNFAGALLGRVDPGYDDLDASVDDFLADIADVATSERRRAWIREVEDLAAGPWDAIS